MSTINLTNEGLQVDNRALGSFDKDECTSHSQRSHKVLFRLYPIASRTGVCANGPYERALVMYVSNHFKHYGSRSNYRVGHLRECYGKCPDSYSCKFLELPVYVKTSKSAKDVEVWIEAIRPQKPNIKGRAGRRQNARNNSQL